MMIRQFTETEREKWNAYVAYGPTFGLFQSWEWGEFKEKMGWKPFRVAAEENGRIAACAQMLIKPLPFGLGSIAYVPRGPLGDWQDSRTVPDLLNELHRIAREHKAVYLKVEPPILRTPENDQMLRGYDFYPSRNSNQPRNTIVAPLDADIDTIFSRLSKNTRYHIKRAMRENISVTMEGRETLPDFLKLLQMTGKREKFPVHKEFYYELMWETLSSTNLLTILTAWHDGKIISVLLVNYFGPHAALIQGGSVPYAKKLHPNYLLAWEAMKWAKTMGCATLDLWGIPDDAEGSLEKDKEAMIRRKDGLWGVYCFKSGFSSNVVAYLGAYDYIYSPALYKIFEKLFFGRNIIDRISVWIETRENRKRPQE